MRRWPRRFRLLIATYYAAMVEYRAELYLWVLAGLLPFVMMAVWMRAARDGGYPLGPDELARYFLAVFIVRQLTVVWVIWDFEHQVVHGGLSHRLLHPMDTLWKYLCEHTAERWARMPFSLLVVLLALCIVPQTRWWPSWQGLTAGLLACWAAFVVRFFLQYLLAMLCFWFERAAAVEQLLTVPYLFLSGAIAPLELYPAWARELAGWTPFPYLMDFPARLLTAPTVDPQQLLRGGLVLLLWSILLILAQRLAWHAGLRRYSSMGA